MLAQAVIGVLLPMSSIRTMRGVWTSTMAAWATTLSSLTIMFVVLEQDSNLTFDF